MSTRFSAALTTAALIIQVGVAHAAPAASNDLALEGTVTEAQERFRRALELYQEGNLDAARAEFHRAYESSPNYRVLYNLGQVEFELHDYPEALATMQKYLREGGARVPADRRAQVTADIEKLQSRVANLDIRVNVQNAQISIDDVPVGQSPLPAPVVVSAGRRRITVSRIGYVSESHSLDVGGGDRPMMQFELRELPGPARVDLSRSESSTVAARASHDAQPAPFPWIGWVLTGALAGGAAVTGSMALREASNLERQRAVFGAERSELDVQKHLVDQWALATDVLLGATAVSAGFSVYFTLARKPNAEAASARVVIGPRSLILSGAF